MNNIKYIPTEKLKIYLKLKKELALFIGIGQYFESKTFDWIRLTLAGELVKAKFEQSFDEGNELFNDVSAFTTVGEIEQETGEEEVIAVSGDIEICLTWIKEKFKADTNCFVLVQDLNQIYGGLVEEGKLGQ